MKKINQYLISVDWLIFGYILLTPFSSESFEHLIIHIYIRLIISLLIVFLIFLYQRHTTKITRFLRFLYPLFTLIYFYPEIDFLDDLLFESFDPILVQLEELIFRVQPSLIFYEKVPFPGLMN